MTKEFKEEVIMVGLPTQDNMELAEQLLQEVGEVSNLLRFYLAPDNLTSFNPLIPDCATGVREMIRDAGLQKHGFEWSKWYSPAREGGNDSAQFLNDIVIGRGIDNRRIFRGKLYDSPDIQYIKALLLEPPHRAYGWQDVAYWNLGKLQELMEKTIVNGCLVLVEAGVLLFADEIQKLHSGETVTPKYWGGLNNWGSIEDKLDTYRVMDECLYRVWAHLLD